MSCHVVRSSQVFAQLIELRSRPLPSIYLAIFPPLLNPMFWERSGNIPALVALVQAYLSKAGDEVVKVRERGRGRTLMRA